MRASSAGHRPALPGSEGLWVVHRLRGAKYPMWREAESQILKPWRGAFWWKGFFAFPGGGWHAELEMFGDTTQGSSVVYICGDLPSRLQVMYRREKSEEAGKEKEKEHPCAVPNVPAM